MNLLELEGKKVKVPILIFEALMLLGIQWDYLSVIAVVISSNYIINLILNSSNTLAIKEFILTLFSLNYLLSPAVIYHGVSTSYAFSAMDLSPQEYFSLAIPGILFFHIGISLIKATIFEIDLSTIKASLEQNQVLLKCAIFGGIVINVLSFRIEGDLSFFLYLLSAIRFIAVFALTADNFKKNWPYVALVFLSEFYFSLQGAAFHDAIIWLIFYGLFLFRLYHPTLKIKLVVLVLSVAAVFILQITKEVYRAKTRTGEEEVGFSTFNSAVITTSEGQGEILSPENISASLTRVNQGFILASTVNNLNYTQQFQGWDLLDKYLEAAFLPRYLAPNKLNAGGGEMFNKYSGRLVNSSTSMGLGIFADGYISFASSGVYIFGFGLGLIFSLVFKVIELWTRKSIFFLLFLFPILHYPVRPDVETQTILGHFVKAVFLYSIFYIYFKDRFKSHDMQSSFV